MSPSKLQPVWAFTLWIRELPSPHSHGLSWKPQATNIPVLDHSFCLTIVGRTTPTSHLPPSNGTTVLQEVAPSVSATVCPPWSSGEDVGENEMHSHSNPLVGVIASAAQHIIYFIAQITLKHGAYCWRPEAWHQNARRHRVDLHKCVHKCVCLYVNMYAHANMHLHVCPCTDVHMHRCVHMC